MATIKIKDIPEDTEISKEDAKIIRGGYMMMQASLPGGILLQPRQDLIQQPLTFGTSALGTFFSRPRISAKCKCGKCAKCK